LINELSNPLHLTARQQDFPFYIEKDANYQDKKMYSLYYRSDENNEQNL